ncbi:MAG: hypothetical protein QGF31_06900, partial [Nitrospinota bacterium]|nr:hypothetical protein [Nitrospinota bacterium]
MRLPYCFFIVSSFTFVKRGTNTTKGIGVRICISPIIISSALVPVISSLVPVISTFVPTLLKTAPFLSLAFSASFIRLLIEGTKGLLNYWLICISIIILGVIIVIIVIVVVVVVFVVAFSFLFLLIFIAV